MQIPWVLSFWMMIAAYVIHVIDESLLGGSFVEKVRVHWWPEYSWRKFFGSTERFCNSIWHVWWTIHFQEYSPGLVSCILIWIYTYFVVFYRAPLPSFTPADLCAAAAIGLGFAAFLVLYIPLAKGRARRKAAIGRVP